MSTSVQNELSIENAIATTKAKLDADYRVLILGFAKNGASAVQLEAATVRYERPLDEIRRDIERAARRNKAASDMVRADEKQPAYDAASAKVDAIVERIRETNETLLALQREQLAAQGELHVIGSEIRALRETATATLQSTAATGNDWRDPANVRLGDAPSPSAAEPRESFNAFHEGEAAKYPSMRLTRSVR